MSDFILAGIFIALLSLIFSKFPFIQLIYVISLTHATNWDEMGMITVVMLISTMGANVYKAFKED